MPEVESADKAEEIVRSYYPGVSRPDRNSLQIAKEGSEWVVRLTVQAVGEEKPQEHEWRIDSETGRVRFRKLNFEGDTKLAERFFRRKDDKREDKREAKATQQEVPALDKRGDSLEDKPNQKAAAEGTTDDYRAIAKQTIENELGNLMNEEIRKAARELAEEQRKAISEAVEQHKLIINEVLAEEKEAIRGRGEEVRRTMRSLAAG